MSKIQLSELKPVRSEFNELSDVQCGDIVGGRRGGRKGGGRKRRAGLRVRNDINVTNIVPTQLNISNNVVVIVNSYDANVAISTFQGNEVSL